MNARGRQEFGANPITGRIGRAERPIVNGMSVVQDLVASAFDLGRPLGELNRIQVSSYETWRLDTSRGSFLVKRLWTGEDPPWRSEHEIAMELERRAMQAGIATAVPVTPVKPAFAWAGRIAGHGVWRVYEWLEHTSIDLPEIDHRWFGDRLALLHKLYPLGRRFEPEWRWLGVYPRDIWERWLDTAARSRKPWATTVESELDRVLAITEYLRDVHQSAGDHIVSHRDLGPWNVLKTASGPVLIDWDSAGPTTASAELGRAVAAFGRDDAIRMRLLIEAYQEAGGTITCRTEDLFIWFLGQQLSGTTERIRIALGDLLPDDDPEPVWMDPATVDEDISKDITTLSARMNELKVLADRVLGSASSCPP